MILQDASELIVFPDEAVKEALAKLTTTEKKVLICTDRQNNFIGVVADGDIRRFLLKGGGVEATLENVVNKSATYVTLQHNAHEVAGILSHNIPLLPVLHHNGQVAGYYSIVNQATLLDPRSKSVTVLGVGYVGLTLGLVMADAGFKISAVDTNTELVEKLRKGKAPFHEVGMSQLLSTHANEGLKFYSSIEEAVSDVYIVTVGTPLLKDGSKTPNVEHAENAVSAIAKVLKKGDLLILRSTLPVGCTRRVIVKHLHDKTNLRCGRDFFVAFVPERTVEGNAVRELRNNPQVVGGYDAYSTELASRIFNMVTHAIIDVGSIEAAELCKLIDNSYRDHVFAFSNFIAQLTESLDLDACKIIDAVNYGYKRNTIPKPSPGVGGPCLSKDPYILASVFKDNSIEPELINATRTINEDGPQRLAKKVKNMLQNVRKNPSDCTISLVGLSFKGEPETSDLRDSTSLWFLQELDNYKEIRGYDPVVCDEDLREIGLLPVSLEGAFENVDAVVVLNNHRSYKNWNLTELVTRANKSLVFVDTWHIFDPLFLKSIEGLQVGGVGND